MSLLFSAQSVADAPETPNTTPANIPVETLLSIYPDIADDQQACSVVQINQARSRGELSGDQNISNYILNRLTETQRQNLPNSGRSGLLLGMNLDLENDHYQSTIFTALSALFSSHQIDPDFMVWFTDHMIELHQNLSTHPDINNARNDWQNYNMAQREEIMRLLADEVSAQFNLPPVNINVHDIRDTDCNFITVARYNHMQRAIFLSRQILPPTIAPRQSI